MTQHLMNILIIALEIGIILLIFSGLQFALKLLLKQSLKVDWIQRFENTLGYICGKLQKLLTLLTIATGVTVLGFNLVIWRQGKNIQRYTLEQLQRIPERFWIDLISGAIASLILLFVVTVVLEYQSRLIQSLTKKTIASHRVKASDRSIENFSQVLDQSLTNGWWLLAAAQICQWLLLPAVVAINIFVALKLYLIISLGLLIARASVAIIETLDAWVQGYLQGEKLVYYGRFRRLIPLAKRCFEWAVYISIGVLVCEQLAFLSAFLEYGHLAIRAIAIVFGAAIAIEASHLAIEKLFLQHPHLTPAQQRRRVTLIPLVQNLARYLIYFGAGVTILYNFDVDPTPILAGAGIVGLAVGLGAQHFVNDVVNGFSILIENYYLVGDFIETDDAEGVVESINLRITHIRHPSGKLYIIRNGNIGKIINYSKEYVYAVVHVGVDYDSNLDHVYRVLMAVGQEALQQSTDILEPLRVDGLDNFGESELTIRTATKTKPGKHLVVARLTRKLIKEAFDRENISIPFAQRVIQFRDGASPEGDRLSGVPEQN